MTKRPVTPVYQTWSVCTQNPGQHQVWIKQLQRFREVVRGHSRQVMQTHDCENSNPMAACHACSCCLLFYSSRHSAGAVPLHILQQYLASGLEQLHNGFSHPLFWGIKCSSAIEARCMCRKRLEKHLSHWGVWFRRLTRPFASQSLCSGRAAATKHLGRGIQVLWNSSHCQSRRTGTLLQSNSNQSLAKLQKQVRGSLSRGWGCSNSRCGM
jgi:hypothetical protein